MYLHLVIPFRTHFSLRDVNVLAEDKAYNAFQQRIADNISNLAISQMSDCELLHLKKKEQSGNLVFETMSDDSIRFSPSVFRFIVKDEWEGFNKKQLLSLEEHQTTALLEYVPQSGVFTLLNNTIGMFEIDFQIQPRQLEHFENWTKVIETWSNKVGRWWVSTFYKEYLYPFILKIDDLDPENRFASKYNRHSGFPDIQDDRKNNVFLKRTTCGVPLWVNRSIVVTEGEDWLKEVLQHWLHVQESKSSIYETMLQKDIDVKNSISLNWGHNLIFNDPSAAITQQAFDAILMAQYSYVLFDALNDNLSYVIGKSSITQKFRSNKYFRKLLDELIFTFNFFKTEYIDLNHKLQGNREYFFRDINHKWNTSELIDNIQIKIDICHQNIDRVYQININKSQKIAEILLLLISGVAILEFIKGISEFSWRQAPEDNVVGIFDLGRLLPPDVLQWLGIVILCIVSAIYIITLNRRDL